MTAAVRTHSQCEKCGLQRKCRVGRDCDSGRCGFGANAPAPGDDPPANVTR